MLTNGTLDDRIKFDFKFKVVLLGESTVGKTTLIQCLEGKPFVQSTMPTIGVDFVKKDFKVKQKRIRLEIWDTAGQERFHSISAFHFRGADCFIFVYDVSQKNTLEKMRSHWMHAVDELCEEPVPIFIVGNKIDKEDDRELKTEDGEEVHEQQYSHGFFETSAKTGENVEEMFQNVAEKLSAIWGLSGTLRSDVFSQSSKKDTITLDRITKWYRQPAECCNRRTSIFRKT